ncbi:MAG: hypothetical protein P8Y58_12565, partial [Novosphingobium sp.]
SMSPDPFSKAAPDRGPVLGEPAPPSRPEPAAPKPAPRVIETPQPQPAQKPKPSSRPALKPVARVTQRPKPAAQAARKPSPARKSSAIDDIIARPGRTNSTPASKGAKTPRKAGASSFAQAFSDGVPGGTSDSGTGMPAAEFGPRQVSALGAAVNRQLKPYWQAPQGADAELLVTRVRFRLNPDGSLDGEPQVLGTTGQTAANKAQVRRHQEQAVRAVKLAAPFDLPKDLYDAWKVVTTNFDRRLSQ